MYVEARFTYSISSIFFFSVNSCTAPQHLTARLRGLSIVLDRPACMPAPLLGSTRLQLPAASFGGHAKHSACMIADRAGNPVFITKYTNTLRPASLPRLTYGGRYCNHGMPRIYTNQTNCASRRRRPISRCNTMRHMYARGEGCKRRHKVGISLDIAARAGATLADLFFDR